MQPDADISFVYQEKSVLIAYNAFKDMSDVLDTVFIHFVE